MPVIARDLIDRLAEHKALGAAPRTELEWLVAHGFIRTLNIGEVLSRKGRQVEGLYIILSGRLALFVDRGAGPNKFIEWRGGDVTGMLPYSRLVTPPGDVSALEPVEILAIPRDHLRGLGARRAGDHGRRPVAPPPAGLPPRLSLSMWATPRTVGTVP